MGVERERKVGRPPKELTQEIQDRICQSLATCCTIKNAVKAVGISDSVFQRWLRKGIADPCSKYGRFYHAIQQAEAVAEQNLVGLIAAASIEDPGHAKWLLAHRPVWKEDWALAPKEIQNNTQNNLHLGDRWNLEALSEEELLTLRALQAKAVKPNHDIVVIEGSSRVALPSGRNQEESEGDDSGDRTPTPKDGDDS